MQATSGTEDLKHAILQSGKRRAYIVTDPATGAPSVSDPSLEPLVQFLASAPDFLRVRFPLVRPRAQPWLETHSLCAAARGHVF